MHRFLHYLILLLSGWPALAFSQHKPSPIFLYLEGGVGLGSVTQGSIELNCLFKTHHQISVGYAAYSRKATTPSDYDGSGLFGTTVPLEYEDGYSICYSYILYPANHAVNDRLRYTLKAGLLLGTYSQPANFHKTGGWFGPNYDYDDVEQPSTAFIFRPGLTYAPSRAFGVSGGLYAVIGKLSGVGVWGSMSLGKVGSHRRHHRKSKH